MKMIPRERKNLLRAFLTSPVTLSYINKIIYNKYTLYVNWLSH